jgi:MoxR-like ATPase
MRAIIDVHFPGLAGELLQSACRIFYALRDVPGLRKRPSTSELLDWIRALLASGAKLPNEDSPSIKSVPFLGALVKMEEDIATLSRNTSRPADVRTAGHRFFR